MVPLNINIHLHCRASFSCWGLLCIEHSICFNPCLDIWERNFFINIIPKVSKYLIYFESISGICQSLSTSVSLYKQTSCSLYFPAHIVIRYISPNQSLQFLKMCTGMFLQLIRHFDCFTMHLLLKNTCKKTCIILVVDHKFQSFLIICVNVLQL